MEKTSGDSMVQSYLGRIVRILFLRDWEASCERRRMKGNTGIGGDGGGGDFVEGLIFIRRVIWIFKRSNRIFSIVERNI